MSIKQIKEQLAKLSTHKEKLDFLEGKLKEAKLKELRLEILELISDVKNSMVREIDIDSIRLDSIQLSESEISRRFEEFQPGSDPLPIARRQSLDFAVSNMEVKNESKQSSYGDNGYGLGLTSSYSFLGIQEQSFSSSSSAFMEDLRDKFIREGVLPDGREVTAAEKDGLRSKLRSIFKGSAEESIMRYESDILNAKSQSSVYQKRII